MQVLLYLRVGVTAEMKTQRLDFGGGAHAHLLYGGKTLAYVKP